MPGNGLGIWRLDEYSRALGYSKPTGIELPGEANGNIPDPTWKRLVQGENWSTGDTYISTIGQGYVTATPIQVLMSYVTLANDGKYIQPTLIKDVIDPEGHVIATHQPQVLWDIAKDPMITLYNQDDQPVWKLDANGKTIPILDANGNPVTDQFGEPQYETEKKTVAPWVIKLVQEGMRKVVVDGTASTIFKDFEERTHIATAGKTGTAEYCDDVARAAKKCEQGKWPAHAWYVGYAPYDNPEIVVLAFVYHGTEGSRVAAPIVKDVIEGYYKLKEAVTTSQTP